MGKTNNDILAEYKISSDKQVEELANKVIEKCKNALGNKNAKKNQTQEKTCSPKLSLDKVSQDIQNILGQLMKNNQKQHKNSSGLIELKIQDKEFFKAETSKKNKTDKNYTKQKPSAQSTHSSSFNFFKSSKNIKKTSETSNGLKSHDSVKSDRLNTIHSNTVFKKIPVTKSEMQKFKRKIELSAMEAIKSPELVKYVDKEKVAKDVKDLMKAALDEGVHAHKVPVIDVGKFINTSLKMTKSNDFPGLKKIAEKIKVKSDHSETKLNQEETDDKKSVVETKDGMENEKNGIETKVKRNDEKKTSKKAEKKNKEDNQIKKLPPELQPLVQTLKTAPNNGYTKAIPPKTSSIGPGQSKTTGNLVVKQKQAGQASQKSALNGNSEVMKKQTSGANKMVVAKGSKNVRPNNVGSTKGNDNNNIKARSNSTLRHSNISMNYKPSNSRPTSGSRESQRRQMTTPVRSFSSGSSRMLSGFRNSNEGMWDSSHSCFGSMRGVNSGMRRCGDPVVMLKEEVNRAIRDKKTFTVQGRYPAVRRALLKRGWVEKFSIKNIEKLEKEMSTLKNRSINQLVNLLHEKDFTEICKKLIKSKLLGNHQVDLYWGQNLESFKINSDKVKLTKINKFKRDVFSYTSKQGLCDAAKNAHWFNFPGLAKINHPRTYALAKNGETNDFMRDFRRTAAMSLLKWVVRSHETRECKIISSSGKIPLEAFQFACNECYKMVIEANNQDIDQPLKEALDHEWSQFLEYYYKILHISNHFKATNQETEESIVEKSKYILNKLIPHYPHIQMDGTMNIWILKPAAGSQGKGIHICRTLQYIMNTVKNHNTIKYIAQKYIERPLLIFNTKFDIRQWFLISCALPLTIWMYKECYLRFSSQTYNLRKLHESVHLTNNSVQKHYQNTSYDITLPRYNMWDSIQFRNYLSNIGYPDIYRKVIYKGMKECIIGAVMIHQDKIDKRKNCFELYGADFMLTEDFQPWLIEINSSPALFASTPITSRMCPQVLEDTIKVIVDHADDPTAKTGNFERIYLQTNIQCNNNAKINNLKISGKPLPKNYFCNEEDKNVKRIRPLSITENLEIEKSMPKSKSETLTEGVKETLENLLKFIQSEKRKRQKKKLVTKGTDPILKEKPDEKESSSTSSCLSFASLKSSLNRLASSNKISFTKEDENMLDQALKMLKNKRNNEVLKYLLDIVERIVNRAPSIET